MRCCIGLLAFGFLLASSAAATTYLVRPDGTGDFPTIQAAIDVAVNGDVIELANGTFTGAANRDLDFHGKALTLRSQAGNPLTCVIDAELMGRNVVFTSGETATTVLEGVTLAQGGAAFDGGGIHCVGSSPTIRNCVLRECQTYYGEGGGIFCDDGSAPLLMDCTIRNCSTYLGYGGGLFCRYSSGVLDHCLFEGNSADNGGGLSCRGSRLTVTGCTFRQNVAVGGGGISCNESGSPSFTDCVIEMNTANGGDFWEALGGGMDTYDGAQPTLTRCRFSHNTALSQTPQNDLGGGFYCYSDSPTLTECTFHANSAYAGGGVGVDRYSSAVLLRCTIVENSAAGVGGGIGCGNLHAPGGSYLSLQNSIIAFSSQGEAFACLGGQCSPNLACCDIFGNAGGDWTDCIAGQYGVNGNISADPLFCYPHFADFRLRDDSPCAPGGACGQIGAWPVGCGPGAVGESEPGALASAMRSSPNPFVRGTTIRYQLGSGNPGGVSVSIYDIVGRLVRTLQASSSPNARGLLRWDGTDEAGRALPGGIYLLRLAGGERTITERVTKVR